MQQITNIDVFVRIACAILCGAVVGWERERKEKAAGLRTHIFVSMGSALVMIVSAFGFGDAIRQGMVVLDPSRVAAQVVSGIGFLGAGVIWFNRNKVRGLDTAAGIWTTSAVGLAAGGAMYIPAFTVTAMVFLMNVLLQPIEQRLFPRSKYGSFLVSLADPSTLEGVRHLIDEFGLKVKAVRSTNTTDGGTVGLDLSGPKSVDWLALVERLGSLEGVLSVTFNEPDVERD